MFSTARNHDVFATLPVLAGPRLTFAWLAAGLSALLGLTVLVGWALDAPVLRSAIPGAVEMKANTAIGLIGVSAAIVAGLGLRTQRQRFLVDLLAVAVALLGLATLAQYAFGLNFGIDEALVRDTGAAFNQAKGRMSPYSASVFAMLGLALWALARSGPLANSLCRLSAGLAAAIGIVSFVGYLWNATEIVTDLIAPPVALNTALGFMLLGSAIFMLAQPPAAARASRSRIERLVLSGFVPTALIVIVGGGLTYQSGANFADSARLVAHTQGVRAEIGRLYAALADAELAQRNLVLVGDPDFDRVFRERAESAGAHAREIGRLVADNPDQLRAEAELSRLVGLRLQALDAIARSYREQGAARATEALAVDSRGGLMARVHELSERMDASEAALLAARLQRAEHQRRTTLVTLLATLAALTGLLLLMFRSVQREIAARNQARDELQRTNLGLEQRVAERTEAVSYEQEFLRRVIDLQNDFVYAKNREGQFVLANRSLAVAMGTTVDALVEQREFDVAVDPADAQRFRAADIAVIDGGREVRIAEEPITLADGGQRWLSTIKRPIVAADGSTIVLGVSTDITERKAAEAEVRQLATDLEHRVAERTADLHESNRQLEQARIESEEASRAKSAFLANMSHEIRTPMNAIIGLTHLMAAEATESRQRERLGKVGEAARHLLQVINDILDMSKIEAGKLTLRESDFAIDDVLSAAMAMVGGRAREKGLELIIDADGLPARFVGDEMRLSQILINLLSNAVKFTEHGWVRLRAETLEDDGARQLLRFEVQDTGPGISAEHQAALFMAFEQADNSLSRRHGGTGLGLALSRQLAKAMGGDAGVTSAPGAGSSFWFSAWLETVTEPAPGVQPVSLAGLRALLVDDLPEARTVIGHSLETLGLTVDALGSGIDALARVEAELQAGRRYDLFVIDARMEPIDGAETLTRLRELLGGTAPPSLLVTAYDDARVADHARLSGFGAVLLKPLTGSALQDPLARLLRHSSRDRRLSPTASSAEAQLRARHAGQRVLLAEDNEVNLEVAQELLGAVGLRVDTATDGARAVAMATAGDYDLVLMDMQMPVMDGLEATRTIRQEARRRVPIIAMTANAFVEDRNACLAAGMDDHVTKPVDPAVMYEVLLRWLPPRAAAAPAPAAPPATVASQAAQVARATVGEAASVADRLAEIGGFDLQVALRLVAGQLPVLVRVLGRFVDTYRKGVPELLETGGTDLAFLERGRRTCHSIRGALTAIGATQLLEELMIMEQSLADAGGPGGLVSRDDLRDMGRHLHEGLLELVRSIEAGLKP